MRGAGGAVARAAVGLLAAWAALLAGAGAQPAPAAPAARTGAAALADGSAWATWLARLAEAGQLPDEPEVLRSPVMRAHGTRHLLRLMSAAHAMTLEYASPERPTLSRIYDLGRKFADDNPNTLYHAFRARPGARYRLRGVPRAPGHPPHFVSVNVRSLGGEGLPGRGHAIHSAGGGLRLDAREGFEVVVGAPAGEGDGLPLDPAAPLQSVAIRQTFYDWARERPLALSLERLDAAGEPPVLDPDALVRALDAMGRFVVFHARQWPEMTARLARHPNRLPALEERDEIAGVPGQRYAHGHFRVAPDEALIVAFEPPTDCHLWSLHAGSFFEESLDYANRQVSVNGHQAHVDADGRFRAVLAHRDPGVPNWIDIGEGEAHREGLLSVRFQVCRRRDPHPAPQTRRVPLAGLRDALPADHPRVTPEARAAELRLRRRHVLERLGR